MIEFEFIDKKDSILSIEKYQEKFSKVSGIIFLLIKDQTITYSINIIAIIMPGIIPAINNFAMDSWTATP